VGESAVNGRSSNLISFNQESEASLEYFFEYHERKSTEIKEKIRNIDESIRKLDLEVNRLNAEINQYRWDIGINNIITIEVENKEKSVENVEVELSVSYHVLSASWTPSYDIRIKDKSKNSHEMILTYFGNVEQHTGEDWKNVELSLSTATPSSGGNLPKPGKTTVHLFRPPPIHPETGRYMMATKRARKSAPCTGGRIITPMNHATTYAKKNALSTTFTISNRKSIPTSSTSTIKVTIT
uniref:DUF4139 domain-containing protein n=1 Tax=Panagrolaimus sp. ES5 TaxID=591445 RepID=A0AC34GH22_9BILA